MLPKVGTRLVDEAVRVLRVFRCVAHACIVPVSPLISQREKCYSRAAYEGLLQGVGRRAGRHGGDDQAYLPEVGKRAPPRPPSRRQEGGGPLQRSQRGLRRLRGYASE